MHRILVIANETCPCPALLDEVRDRATSHDEHHVLIIAPALNSRLRHYLSDVDEALEAARERLDTALEFLRGEGVGADGTIGDADPFVAVEDAMHGYEASEIMVSTHPPGRSHWLEHGLPEKIEQRFQLPVLHLTSEYGAATA